MPESWSFSPPAGAALWGSARAPCEREPLLVARELPGTANAEGETPKYPFMKCLKMYKEQGEQALFPWGSRKGSEIRRLK